MTDQIVVLIPALNMAETLPRQLTALDAQTDLDFRVMVCDNGSTDTTQNICQEWRPRFRSLGVVDASSRRGVASARNAGIMATAESLILICDADDRVHPSWVAAMREALVHADGVTGPLHLIRPGDDGVHEVWNAESLPVAMGHLAYLPGGNAGLRRTVIDRIGLFDAGMTLGQEDVDFGWRMAEAGFSLAHAPGAAIDYYQRGDLRALLRAQWRYGRAHVALYAKHAGEAPAPASHTASLRWFWHWARQYPTAVHAGRGRIAIGDAAFQMARFVETLRLGTRSPL